MPAQIQQRARRYRPSAAGLCAWPRAPSAPRSATRCPSDEIERPTIAAHPAARHRPPAAWPRSACRAPPASSPASRAKASIRGVGRVLQRQRECNGWPWQMLDAIDAPKPRAVCASRDMAGSSRPARFQQRRRGQPAPERSPPAAPAPRAGAGMPPRASSRVRKCPVSARPCASPAAVAPARRSGRRQGQQPVGPVPRPSRRHRPAGRGLT